MCLDLASLAAASYVVRCLSFRRLLVYVCLPHGKGTRTENMHGCVLSNSNQNVYLCVLCVCVCVCV